VHHIGGAAPVRTGMGAPYGCRVPGGVHLRESADVITLGGSPGAEFVGKSLGFRFRHLCTYKKIQLAL
jgi:hypothetical protein